MKALLLASFFFTTEFGIPFFLFSFFGYPQGVLEFILGFVGVLVLAYALATQMPHKFVGGAGTGIGFVALVILCVAAISAPLIAIVVSIPAGLSTFAFMMGINLAWMAYCLNA